MIQSKVGMAGDLMWEVRRGGRKVSLGWKLRNNLRWGFIKGWISRFVTAPIAKAVGLTTIMSEVSAIKYSADGTYVDYGVVGRRSITNAYCTFVCLMHQTDQTTMGDWKFHDSGVGTTAENVTDTDMETSDAVARATGDQTASALTYKSVGTITYDSTKAITEHGLFNASTSVTLMDRTKFDPINVVNTDSIQFTYTITYVAGS